MEVVVTAVGVDQAVVEVTTKDGTVIETAEMVDLIEVGTVLVGIIAVETTILTETKTEALTEAGRTTLDFRKLPIAIQKRPKTLRIVRRDEKSHST